MDIVTLEYKSQLGQIFAIWTCDLCDDCHVGIMVLDHVDDSEDDAGEQIEMPVAANGMKSG